MKFNRVVIIGVGEIGGSIGKALKKRRLAKEIIGIGRRHSSLNKAKKVGACDKIFLIDNMREGLKDADLIVIATPVLKIVELGKRAALFAKEGAIITDVGSTKKYIVEKLEKHLPEKVKFVGSHPMAGSEKGGPQNCDRDLFVDKNCFVVKTKKTDRKSLNAVKEFWKALGAEPIEVSLSDHDKIVAGISHLVHITASSLVLANKKILKYAASGFRDATRIALSDPALWEDICATNRANISASIDSLIDILKRFKGALSKKKISDIHKLLKKAQDLRSAL